MMADITSNSEAPGTLRLPDTYDATYTIYREYLYIESTSLPSNNSPLTSTMQATKR